MSGIVGGLESVWQAIVNLPQIIVDGIKEILIEIFVPDAEDINANIDAFLNELRMKFGFDTAFFEGLFDGEMQVQDVYTDYEISGVGSFTLKVLDTKFFVDGVTYFRPFIRGFLVLLMALFNIQQILSFIRQDAGVVAGKSADIDAGTKFHDRPKRGKK